MVVVGPWRVRGWWDGMGWDDEVSRERGLLPPRLAPSSPCVRNLPSFICRPVHPADTSPLLTANCCLLYYLSIATNLLRWALSIPLAKNTIYWFIYYIRKKNTVKWLLDSTNKKADILVLKLGWSNDYCNYNRTRVVVDKSLPSDATDHRKGSGGGDARQQELVSSFVSNWNYLTH